VATIFYIFIKIIHAFIGSRARTLISLNITLSFHCTIYTERKNTTKTSLVNLKVHLKVNLQ